MNTTTITDAATRYLEAVRKGLTDLPEDDAEEVLQDLEAHLVELGDIDIEATLGTPGEFIAEFRSSAGLDRGGPAPRSGWISRNRQRVSARLGRTAEWTSNTLASIVAPLARYHGDIRTAWIWSRGILAVLTFAWFTDSALFGNHLFLGARLTFGLGLLVAATYVSVRLAGATTKRWKRLDLLVSIGAGLLILGAVNTTHYVPYPEEQGFIYQDGSVDQDGFPVLLIGPNGPIQNLFAYDTAGNPVEVLLYDEYGNPILTMPPYAYESATSSLPDGEPFIWEGYEVRFQEDTYGRPIGNLYPLARYEWTETGARSDPQPPPVVGIPELPTTEVATTTTLAPATTRETVGEATTSTTEPPTTTTEGG